LSSNERYILFVSRSSPASARAIAALPKVRAEAFGVGAIVDVVDVASDAARADEYRILATPTLVRVAPLPAKRIVGDLADANLVRSVMTPPRLEDGHPKRPRADFPEER
jgi:circadian clock protein KaiB